MIADFKVCIDYIIIANCYMMMIGNLNQDFKQKRKDSENGIVGDFANLLVSHVSVTYGNSPIVDHFVNFMSSMPIC